MSYEINARDLWDVMSIREETPDEWGREGKGITLVYFNKDYENTNFIPSENLKDIKQELIKRLKHRFRNDLDYIVPFMEIIEEVIKNE